ncbi:hypothetical protein WJX84_005598 [Apatococcus fuscideae]|uniref:Ysc84 actin-binding domain-containing protein n=1 Tax=Apatococcus fuscideae TaxID=2026836 RepID=A0AAW1S4L1_9CHLO
MLRQELREVISACLTKQADLRPTAPDLLKLKFFKNAPKHREQVVKGLLADLPTLEERLEELKERPLRSTSFKLARTSTGGGPGPVLVREASSNRRKLQSRPSSSNLHPRDLGPQEAMMLLARLKPSPTLTSQASSSALHRLSKVLPFIHVSDEGPHLPAEVIRAAKGVGFVAGWRGSLGVRHAWSFGFAMAKLSDSPTDGSTWSGPSFYYLADSGMGGVGYERRQAVLILCTDEAVAKFKNTEGFNLSELKLESHYSGTLDARHALRNIEKYQAKKTAYVIAMRFADGGVLFSSQGGQSTPSRASNEAAYGSAHSNADILNGKVAPPEAYNDVIQALISIEKVAISRSRAASPSPSCQRLDLLVSEGSNVVANPVTSDSGACSPLRRTSPEARHDGGYPPRKSPLSKQGSTDGSSSCPPDFTFSGLTSAQWGLQFADHAAAAGSSLYGSEVGSVSSVDQATLGSPTQVVQQAAPGGQLAAGQDSPDDDNEPAMTHYPHPGVLLSEEQQRARSHPYPHDVLRPPSPPVAPGRSNPPRPPLSRLGRSASNASHEGAAAVIVPQKQQPASEHINQM